MKQQEPLTNNSLAAELNKRMRRRMVVLIIVVSLLAIYQHFIEPRLMVTNSENTSPLTASDQLKDNDAIR